jgi:hypothetical protein
MDRACTGGHRYFVAETAADEQQGTVSIIALCTSCGDSLCRTFTVAKGPISLSKDKNADLLPLQGK